MNEGIIDPETKRRIMALFLDGRSSARGQPIVYAMAGAPRAGKSTFVDQAIARGEFPANAFILDPDRVMHAVQAYHDDCQTMGRDDAFARWQMPTRNLAYAMGQEAKSARLNIIKDMGLVRRENWDFLADCKRQGYRVIVHHIICDVREAERRNVNGRGFPRHEIAQRVQSLDALMQEHAHIADVLYRFDNSDLQNPFRKVQSVSALRPIRLDVNR